MSARRRRRRRRARRRVRSANVRQTRQFNIGRWFTLSRIWSILALLAVLMLIVSLIAPALGPVAEG